MKKYVKILIINTKAPKMLMLLSREEFKNINHRILKVCAL